MAGSAEDRGCVVVSLEPAAPSAPQLVCVAGRLALVVLSREEKHSQSSEMVKWLKCCRSF